MKRAILVPGRPDKEQFYDPAWPTNNNNYWFPWVLKQLQINDVWAVAIDPPTPWQPRYDVWKREFERFDITPETILIGHSCGGGFLVRWLSENQDIKVGRVILVAPWLNPENNPVSDTADFFDFKIDVDLLSRTNGATVFNSDNDYATIQESVRRIVDSLPGIRLVTFHNKGHFRSSDLGTVAFPELLEEALRV